MGLRIVVTFPLSLGVPGGGTEDCLNLVRHMRRQGAEITVLSCQSAGPGQYPRQAPSREAYEKVAQELEDEGIRTLAVPTHPLHYLLDGRPIAATRASSASCSTSSRSPVCSACSRPC